MMSPLVGSAGKSVLNQHTTISGKIFPTHDTNNNQSSGRDEDDMSEVLLRTRTVENIAKAKDVANPTIANTKVLK